MHWLVGEGRRDQGTLEHGVGPVAGHTSCPFGGTRRGGEGCCSAGPGPYEGPVCQPAGGLLWPVAGQNRTAGTAGREGTRAGICDRSVMQVSRIVTEKGALWASSGQKRRFCCRARSGVSPLRRATGPVVTFRDVQVVSAPVTRVTRVTGSARAAVLPGRSEVGRRGSAGRCPGAEGSRSVHPPSVTSGLPTGRAAQPVRTRAVRRGGGWAVWWCANERGAGPDRSRAALVR